MRMPLTRPGRRPATTLRGWSTPPTPLVGRRGVIALLVIALAGGLFVSTPAPRVSADSLSDAYAQQTKLQKEMAAQKAQISALNSSQASLSAKLASTKNSLDATISNLDAVKGQIVGMVVDVANAQSAVDELDATVAQLDAQLSDQEAQEAAARNQLDAQLAILASRIRDAYASDRTSLLETFLSSSDFTDVLTQVDDHLSFADQDRALADQIAQDQQVLGVLHQNTELLKGQADTERQAAAQQQAQLDSKLAALNAERQKLQQLQKAYQAMIAEQKAQYAKLASNKAALAKSLASEAAAEKKLQSLINKLVLEQLQAGGIPSKYNGTLTWPMPGVVTQPFGCTGFVMEPPLGSCAHFHTGIDIANTAWTPIHAAGPGKVIYAGKSPYDPAYIVIIAHSSSLVTWYAHIQTKIPVHVGQYVSTGQVIAYEGCTGWCTGPHLHWAVELNGTWENPRLFL